MVYVLENLKQIKQVLTYLIKDISSSGDAEPIALKVIKGVLYFSAYSDDFATELWKTDGTEAVTVMVKDINPDGHPKAQRFEPFLAELECLRLIYCGN